MFLFFALLVGSRLVKSTEVRRCGNIYDESDCEELRGKGFCVNPQTRAVMRQNCAASCGHCRRSQSDVCEDSGDNCADWRDVGLCEERTLTQIERERVGQCRATCELCREGEECVDTFTKAQCNRLVAQGRCQSMGRMMSRVCADSCGFCDQDEEDLPVGGWSDWGVWSLCDVVCGQGVRYRSRSCRGGNCHGPSTETGECTVEDCPKDVCRGEEEDYCPYFKALGYCSREASDAFMKEHCAVSCETCREVDEREVSLVSGRYKLCVERVMNDVISATLNTLSLLKAKEHTKSTIAAKARLPEEAQDSLRRLSRNGLALTLQDRLFNAIVEGINGECGVESHGTRGFIESKLLESKVIQVSSVDCSAFCDRPVGETFRSINGTCNNCENPTWGASTSTILRILDAEYEDRERSTPRGWAQNDPMVEREDLPRDLVVPSARLVTQMLINEWPVRETRLSLMHFQWGQFLDHDLVLIPTNPESVAAGGDVDCGEECSNIHPCFPIPLSPKDPIANMSTGHRSCLPFTRSAGIRFNVVGASAFSNQINEITSYVDGSNVYGSSEFLSVLLRGSDGELREGGECATDPEGPLLPTCPEHSSGHFCVCGLENCPEKFIAGDTRVNEQPMLTLMHTIWVREHNRIVRELRRINPCWDGDRLFQETRRIVVAVIQHITYRLYLPVLLGPAGYRHYIGFQSEYDPTVQAGILNEFATAAYRFGHSQIPEELPVVNEQWEKAQFEELHTTFFRAGMMCNCGFDNILRGMLSTPVNKVDNNFAEDVLHRLFAPHGHSMGLDLVSINIQRGRDHGLPPYVRYRRYCEERYFTKPVLREGAATRRRIDLVYGGMERVDLFVGGMLEEPVNDGLLGPTFSCIVGEQFQRLRDGDRFFYTHPGVFTPAQLGEILKSGLAKVLCENSKTVDRVPRSAFLVDGVEDMVGCEELPAIDLQKWRDPQCD